MDKNADGRITEEEVKEVSNYGEINNREHAVNSLLFFLNIQIINITGCADYRLERFR